MNHERDDQLDERIRAMARQIHEPPRVPREAMWTAIQARRDAAKVVPIHTRRNPRTLVWIAALAASLLLGVALDRWVIQPAGGEPGRVAETPSDRADEPPSAALQVATTQHLSRVETFLTGFRTTDTDSTFGGQARDLLTSTRLLLDNPSIHDARVRGLLQDLELILVQIVQSTASDRPSERQLITDGLQQRQVLPRLRSQIPAGQSHFGAL
jgi:hypothetical protein